MNFDITDLVRSPRSQTESQGLLEYFAKKIFIYFLHVYM